MYSDVITVFNKYVDSTGNITWYPSVVENVNVNIDKASILSKYGPESKDNAVLNIKYSNIDGSKVVEGKKWLPPIDWENQVNDELASTLTFKDGNFFYLGEWQEAVINNADYKNGFYDYMNKNYDFVFLITSVSVISLIPHFEITGK